MENNETYRLNAYRRWLQRRSKEVLIELLIAEERKRFL